MAEARDLAAPVEYPESDDTPVESMMQWNVVAQVAMALRRHLGRRALVAANMGVYYRRGDPKGVVVPDLFVALGEPIIDVPDVYLVWEQGKPPDFALEVASKSTFRRDRREKIAIYRKVGVKEYFLHDATGRFLQPRLQGYRCVDVAAADGEGKTGGEADGKADSGKSKRRYVPIEPAITPSGGIRLYSKVLKLDFNAVPGEPAPRLYGPDGALLLSHEDAAAEEQRRRLEEAGIRREAEQGRREAELGRREAESQRRQEEGHRLEAERLRLEERNRRLEAERELAALRRRLATLGGDEEEG